MSKDLSQFFNPETTPAVSHDLGDVTFDALDTLDLDAAESRAIAVANATGDVVEDDGDGCKI